MNRGELLAKLGVGPDVLKTLLAEGLPRVGRGRSERFDWEAVCGWLEAHGYAERQPVEQIATTYAELAGLLGMVGTNPERTIAGWVTKPGFPGRPGTPGRRDAYLPVEQIRQWLADQQTGRRNGVAGAELDDETRELQRQLLRLKLERETRETLLELGRLADVDQVAQFNRQCIANAKSILETLPETIVDTLPRLGPEERANVFLQIRNLIDSALQEIGRLVEGDTETDASDDDDS